MTGLRNLKMAGWRSLERTISIQARTGRKQIATDIGRSWIALDSRLGRIVFLADAAVAKRLEFVGRIQGSLPGN